MLLGENLTIVNKHYNTIIKIIYENYLNKITNKTLQPSEYLLQILNYHLHHFSYNVYKIVNIKKEMVIDIYCHYI